MRVAAVCACCIGQWTGVTARARTLPSFPPSASTVPRTGHRGRACRPNDREQWLRSCRGCVFGASSPVAGPGVDGDLDLMAQQNPV